MLDAVTFGRRLVETGDLDPVYVALHGARLHGGQVSRLLLAYWCCYHLGAAAYLSEFSQAEFWSLMREMARNETAAPAGSRWPRAAERRHFRGIKCVEAVDWLAGHYPQPEDAVAELLLGSTRGIAYRTIQHRVMAWPMFGPWIAFKAGDMLERVLGAPVQFQYDQVMYESPTTAAVRLWEADNPGQTPPTGAVFQVVHDLILSLSTLSAPPRNDRPIGLQEVETVLCKWGSHREGRYEVGRDITEVRHGLEAWAPHSGAARLLLAACPPEVP